jgi:hypothetical protein
MRSILIRIFLFSLPVCLILCGCQSHKGDFVPKTEAELAAMEQKNQQAHSAFLKGDYKTAEKILRQMATERTVSRPLYQLELLSVLLFDGKHQEAHELMKILHTDFETLFDRKSEEKHRASGMEKSIRFTKGIPMNAVPSMYLWHFPSLKRDNMKMHCAV